MRNPLYIIIAVLILSGLGLSFGLSKLNTDQQNDNVATIESFPGSAEAITLNTPQSPLTNTLPPNSPLIVEEGDFDSRKIYIVELSNGQFYFGNIKTIDSNFYWLYNIYYVTEKTTDNTIYTTVANLERLGEEIHLPYNSMIINKKHLVEATEGAIQSPSLTSTVNSFAFNRAKTGLSQTQISSDSSSDFLNQNNAQAVFLDDGRVYFAQMTSIGESLVWPETVYFIDNTGEPLLSTTSEYVRGNYTIDNVVFWENLNPSGKFSKEILGE